MIVALFAVQIIPGVIWEVMVEAVEGDVEEVFQELAMKLVNKILQLRGPEVMLCQQTDQLLNHRLVQHIDILQAVGREHFLYIVYRWYVGETNRYHNQHVAAEPSRHRGSGVLLLGRKWRHLYFGILIYMGIVKLPRMHMYSSTDI